MTLNQFLALDEVEQAEQVVNGVHIGDRQDQQHSILLYQIHGFYVEVFYHREHNEIVRLRTFSHVGQLQPYLDKIDISELITARL